MEFQNFVSFFFSFGMFLNGTLFIPQAIKLLRTKNSEGLSLITFGGFCLIQISSILHGFFGKDYMLMIGMGYSLVTCCIVTILIFINRSFFTKK